MDIIRDSGMIFKKGHFGEVREGALYISDQLADYLALRNIRTAEDFITFLQLFSKDLARALSWLEAECSVATIELRNLLQGHIDQDILDILQPSDQFHGVA